MRHIVHEPYADTLALADKIINAVIEDGGITISRRGEDAPTKGYIVGSAHNIRTLKLPEETSADTLKLETARWIERLPTKVEWLGGWIDEGVLYIDACDIHDSRIVAESVGIARGELAIYNLTTGETLTI